MHSLVGRVIWITVVFANALEAFRSEGGVIQDDGEEVERLDASGSFSTATMLSPSRL